MRIKVEFAGGLDMLFNAKQLEVDIPDDTNIRKLIELLRDEHIKRDRELFATGSKIRPGVLILVNDVDFEVLESYDYKLKQNDTVLFVSTLHGG